MRFFNLSLQWRLVLAAFSGLLTYPANLLDSALGPDWYPPILSWWLILHGLLFGALVMAPYVLRKDHRVLRAAIGDTRVLGHEPARRHARRLPLQPDVRDLSLGRVLTPVENLTVYIWLDRVAGTHLRSHVPGTAS